ncbi:tRNA (uridine(34)/cytosine(34)/5-carboxymethylaminomethyluridine(34)-2'-O)-methyltransferase TrmL [Fictibacillus sp. WQ 8-8]|uniref:tRNA (uridine(34)/cytosine(34)/5- carboxymethylaminomethyluridine(34)-2'-O)- methyltransferase TrmL n=1 Tax=unclassified Fictibacillus TaxID=2644029 RepID=UPI0006A7B2F2|nr:MULTISPECIES: tRNA (uridine(34)/cytosine(34)/5-carboxymethylaminomethyluridine(34)-2'-O)-methyltransferase TrmL [unclassified Fictibacillus]MCQ6267123.1 tRNA (uridine(34)/cytosine(34)/5-carboxymethylaminomethyluridine(34)-2'-O)-methyltransferase TrmL [Fictibacillus sp. WQ 8-8]MED2972100.1 tRNA (uridine(34)/cytosine(34)/5-carboxymethylaminomethyluridine(34)-2'-O)-methyltransferase TrmL [Fictibacillus sp. B-59209]SFE25829.1 tRNA (cytidine/uridine-2'-O-)-methyltransferase [Bacillus sp. OV194]
MGLHVVLYQPLIPANTGNIARTCAGTGTSLHLIRPLGFSTDDKQLKRAGLDYWEHVDVHYYDSLEELFECFPEGLYYYITKFGKQRYCDMNYSESSRDHFFVFGRETTGLPQELLKANEERCFRLPMNENIRSLNLSNTAAILIYEALRQQEFPTLD